MTSLRSITDTKILRNTFPQYFRYTEARPQFVTSSVLFDKDNIVLTKDQESRRRYQRVRSNKPVSKPELFHTYNLYREFLSPETINKWKLDDVFKDIDPIKHLKWIGNKNKKERLDSEWRKLVDLSTLSDYIVEPPIDNFKQTVKDWVGKRKVHKQGTHSKYISEFETHLSKVLDKLIIGNKISMSIDEYCNNPLAWGKPGAAISPYDARPIVNIAGENITVGTSKWAAALELSPTQVRDMIFNEQGFIAKPFVKRETAKARPVVAAGLKSYLNMDYISRAWLEGNLNKDWGSHLWMNSKSIMSWWEDNALFTGDYRVPVDQTNWDWNQSRREILIVISELSKRVPPGNKDLDNAFEALIKKFKKGKIIFPDGSRYLWKNGILSGWRWTALLNSILNLTQLFMANSSIRNRGYRGLNLDKVNVLGDDAAVRCYDFKSCIALIETLNAYGFDINPGKNFISNDTDEYLRKVITHRKIIGYPARSIHNIVWRNPVNRPDPRGPERLNTILSLWSVFMSRMESWLEQAYFDRMLDDMHNATMIAKNLIRRWLFTPRILGGGGLTPTRREFVMDWVSITGGGDVYNIGEREVYVRGKGAEVIRKSFNSLFDINLKDSSFLQFLQIRDNFKKKLKTKNKIKKQIIDVELPSIKNIEQNKKEKEGYGSTPSLLKQERERYDRIYKTQIIQQKNSNSLKRSYHNLPLGYINYPNLDEKVREYYGLQPEKMLAIKILGKDFKNYPREVCDILINAKGPSILSYSGYNQDYTAVKAKPYSDGIVGWYVNKVRRHSLNTWYRGVVSWQLVDQSDILGIAFHE